MYAGVLARYLSSEALGFSAFRLGLALATLLAFALLWRQPRPRMALAVVLAMHVAAWLAYRAPLQRPYGAGEGSDRTFNLGMAASVAVGHSPFEHTQVRHASPEPFWNLALALLAGMDPRRVAGAYDALTPLAIVAVGLGAYAWVRRDGSEDERWRGVLAAFAVLGLSSLAMNPRPPVPPFWVANFLYKPNHGIAYALVAAAVGLCARDRGRSWPLALVLGLLAWVFLLGWAYAVAGVLVAVALRPAAERRWRPALSAVGLSALAAAPYVGHLARDYAPTAAGATAAHMWNDPNALLLAVPNWATLDLGPLLSLGLAGLWLSRGRTSGLDATVAGFGLAAGAMWAASMPLALLGFAPEPDELHYFLRFVMSVAAAMALAAAAGWTAGAWSLTPGRPHLVAMAACLPITFPIYHDPPTMDRYFEESCRPLPSKVLAYGDWIRDHAPRDAVFAAGRSAAMWIPALTGRRVLLSEAGKLLPRDYDQRKTVERVLLTTSDPAAAREAAQRFGVTHIAIDEDLMHEYGAASFALLAHAPWDRTVFANTAARVVELRWPGSAPGGSSLVPSR